MAASAFSPSALWSQLDSMCEEPETPTRRPAQPKPSEEISPKTSRGKEGVNKAVFPPRRCGLYSGLVHLEGLAKASRVGVGLPLQGKPRARILDPDARGPAGPLPSLLLETPRAPLPASPREPQPLLLGRSLPLPGWTGPHVPQHLGHIALEWCRE